MFDGAYKSLEAIADTNTIRVPKPIAVIADPKGGGAMLVMEYLNLKSLGSQAAEMGRKLAK